MRVLVREVPGTVDRRVADWWRYAAFLAVVNVVDAAATLALIDRGAVEVSPGLAPLWLSLPRAEFILLKALWAPALVFLLRELHRRGSWIARPGTALCCWLYGAALLWQAWLLVTHP